MEYREEWKRSGRVAVAKDRTGKVFLVVWLGKRGRVCQKLGGFKTGRSVYVVIFHKVPLSVIHYSVHSVEGRAPFSHQPRLELDLSQCTPSVLCCLISDFNIFLNAELGQGLFDAQRCQAGSSISIPTLSHYFTHDPQGLEQQEEEVN